MNRFALTTLLAVLLSPSLFANSAIDRGAITPTKYMVIFKQYESDLLAAQAAKDTVRLDAILAPTFEMRKGNGELVPKRTWIDLTPLAEGRPQHLVAYELGPYAIAQFRLAAPGDPHGVSVVDVWVPEGDKWRLRVRFETPLS